MKKQPRQTKDSASITRSQPFAAMIGVAEDGVKKKLVLQSPAWYNHQLNKFKVGEMVTLEIHNRKSKRTLAQNNYYFGVYLPLIGKETGEHNIDRLHALFGGKFLTEMIVEVLGQKTRIKKSTTELNIGEFSEYIMNIEAETGIEAPPTESYGLVNLKEGRDYPQRPVATSRRSGKIDT